MINVVKITDLEDGYFIITWYYEKDDVQIMHTFEKSGAYNTLRNVEILIAHGYSVESLELLKKLQSLQNS